MSEDVNAAMLGEWERTAARATAGLDDHDRICKDCEPKPLCNLSAQRYAEDLSVAVPVLVAEVKRLQGELATAREIARWCHSAIDELDDEEDVMTHAEYAEVIESWCQ